MQLYRRFFIKIMQRLQIDWFRMWQTIIAFLKILFILRWELQIENETFINATKAQFQYQLDDDCFKQDFLKHIMMKK
jgi:hypothetical protein